MPIYVKASRRARAHTRGSRSKLARAAKKQNSSKLDMLKANLYGRFIDAKYGEGVPANYKSSISKRYLSMFY